LKVQGYKTKAAKLSKIVIPLIQLKLVNTLDKLLRFTRDFKRNGREFARQVAQLLGAVFHVLAGGGGVRQTVRAVGQILYDGAESFADGRADFGFAHGVVGRGDHVAYHHRDGANVVADRGDVLGAADAGN
jgi:hypothetical protein